MKYIMFFTFLAALPLAAQDYVERGWYVGVEGGQGSLEDSSDETLGGVFAGFQFNRHFALEGGYQNLDTVEDPGGDEAPGEADVEGWKLLAVGKVPLAPRFSLVGKAGLFGSKVDTVFFDAEDRTEENESDVGFAFEGGLEFKLSNRWRAELAFGNYATDTLDVTIVNDEVEITTEIETMAVVKVGLSFVF